MKCDELLPSGLCSNMSEESTLDISFIDNFTDIIEWNRTFNSLDHGPEIFEDKHKETSSDIMAIWVQVAWSTVFFIMIAVATGGNCIVIWIVTAHRRMRTVTNYFLVNLSVADLLLTTFNCAFNFIYMVQRNWPFGNVYCTISNFIANATVAASVFTLTGISCDRYLAIVHPLHPRMSKGSSLLIISLIWLASMTFAVPCLIYSTTITNRYKGTEKTGCILIWPDNKIVGSKYDFWYQMLFMTITYLVPMTLMSLCYTLMGRVLWGSRSIGELTQRQIDSIRSKRKVVKMFILVVLIFGICWLPYHAYFIYIYYDTKIIFGRYTQHVFLGFYWFAMSNAMVNPLIYYWMNARFRQYFKSVICGWKSCLVNRMDSAESPPMLDRNYHSYSKSGGGGTIKVQMCSPNDKENGNAHHSMVVNIDDEKPQSGSSSCRTSSRRWSRKRSLQKDSQKTTFNL